MSGFRSVCKRPMVYKTTVAIWCVTLLPPIGDQPALLTHDEVITLFHEFDHGLHHMSTEVDNISVAGTHGVAWDAVELPSQFMEFWAWDNESLRCTPVNTPKPSKHCHKNCCLRLTQCAFLPVMVCKRLRQIEFLSCLI